MDDAAAARVLVIGLDPSRVPGPWDPAPVVEGIEDGRRRFAEAAARRLGQRPAS